MCERERESICGRRVHLQAVQGIRVERLGLGRGSRVQDCAGVRLTGCMIDTGGVYNHLLKGLRLVQLGRARRRSAPVQGYLAHKKHPPPVRSYSVNLLASSRVSPISRRTQSLPRMMLCEALVLYLKYNLYPYLKPCKPHKSCIFGR